MRQASFLLLPLAIATLSAAPVAGQTWIEREMAYRVSAVPEGSAAARSGLRVFDVLAEPAPLPARLLDASGDGVEIPVYRFDRVTGRYARSSLKVLFKTDEEKRLGTTGDLGFFVIGTKPRSLGERAELKGGDFIPQINDTFVHSLDDLKLVDQAYDKGEQVFINFIRWLPESSEFKTFVSRRRFVK